jgi:hypothetical protein
MTNVSGTLVCPISMVLGTKKDACDLETLVVHQETTPGNNPEDFKQHYDHGGSHLQGFLLSKTSKPTLRPTQFPVQGVSTVFPPEVKRQGSEVDCVPILSKLKINGAVPPLPLYVFMACTGTVC